MPSILLRGLKCTIFPKFKQLSEKLNNANCNKWKIPIQKLKNGTIFPKFKQLSEKLNNASFMQAFLLKNLVELSNWVTLYFFRKLTSKFAWNFNKN